MVHAPSCSFPSVGFRRGGTAGGREDESGGVLGALLGHAGDRIGDLEADAHDHSHDLAVLLHRVVHDRAGGVGDDALVEHLVGDVLSDADDELRPVGRQQHGLGRIPAAVEDLVAWVSVQVRRLFVGQVRRVDGTVVRITQFGQFPVEAGLAGEAVERVAFLGEHLAEGGHIGGEVLAGSLRDGVLGGLRAGEDVVAPGGRLVDAEDGGLVDLLAERLGDQRLHGLEQVDGRVLSHGVRDRDEHGEFFGGDVHVLPTAFGGLLEASLGDPVGFRQGGEDRLGLLPGAHGHALCTGEHDALLRHGLDDLLADLVGHEGLSEVVAFDVGIEIVGHCLLLVWLSVVVVDGVAHPVGWTRRPGRVHSSRRLRPIRRLIECRPVPHRSLCGVSCGELRRLRLDPFRGSVSDQFTVLGRKLRMRRERMGPGIVGFEPCDFLVGFVEVPLGLFRFGEFGVLVCAVLVGEFAVLVFEGAVLLTEVLDELPCGGGVELLALAFPWGPRLLPAVLLSFRAIRVRIGLLDAVWFVLDVAVLLVVVCHCGLLSLFRPVLRVGMVSGSSRRKSDMVVVFRAFPFEPLGSWSEGPFSLLRRRGRMASRGSLRSCA
nr:MAG TPA: hypothetical protein [Caudoviricetes sp.]